MISLLTSANELIEVSSQADFFWQKDDLILKSWNQKDLLSIKFKNPKSVSDCRINGDVCKNLEDLRIDMQSISVDKVKFKLTYIYKGVSLENNIYMIDPNISGLTFQGKSIENKNYIFSISNGDEGHLFIIDANGLIKFYRKVGVGIHDFKPQKLKDKKVYYSYQEARFSNYNLNSRGPYVVLDSNFDEKFRTQQWLDNHHFSLITPQHYWGISYESEVLTTGLCYINQSIVEYKNGKRQDILSTLDLLKKSYLYRYQRLIPFENKEKCLHTYHLNYFQLVGDDKILVSLGNDGIIMWNIKKKNIEWALGGLNDQFQLALNQQTSLHHTPMFDQKSETLILFDNNLKERKSRVLQYQLSIKDKKIKSFNILSDEKYYTEIMGSVYADALPVNENSALTISYGGGRKEGVLIQEFLNRKLTVQIELASPGWYVSNVYRAN